MKKLISIVSLGIYFCTIMVAQNTTSKKQFDELWSKADSTAKNYINSGDPTKDLNTIQLNKINSVDVKQKHITNKNYKKIDTSNLEEFSTKPIVKGATVDDKSIKPKEAVIDLSRDKSKMNTPKIENVKVIKEEVKEIPKEIKTTNSSDIVKSTPVKPTKYDEDFSTKPIVNGKKVDINTNNASSSPTATKVIMDTTKGFREFTFETKPVVNGNVSYNRRNEPMPKSKEQIEDEIPVNRKPNNTNVDKDNSFIKEAYAQYDKEADSLHSANKMRLDSIMKALNIKVPVVINPSEFIDIYVSGGGAIVDNNSKLYDRISILHTGIIQREYKTKNEGVQRTEKKISKDELTKLAQYIVDMDFLDFNKDYDCADGDAVCNQRFSKTPQIVPLEISLTAGQRKNKVKVAIYAPTVESNLVNYPANLEKIMNAIYTIVEK